MALFSIACPDRFREISVTPQLNWLNYNKINTLHTSIYAFNSGHMIAPTREVPAKVILQNHTHRYLFEKQKVYETCKIVCRKDFILSFLPRSRSESHDDAKLRIERIDRPSVPT